MTSNLVLLLIEFSYDSLILLEALGSMTLLTLLLPLAWSLFWDLENSDAYTQVVYRFWRIIHFCLNSRFSSSNIKSSTFIARQAISGFFSIKNCDDLLQQAIVFLFMLSGSNVVHGHAYPLNCGYGFIKVVLGNDNVG